MNIPENELEGLLSKLCVDLGFCLPDIVQSRLIKFPPKTAERFAEAVVEAEGLNLQTMEKSLYKRVLKEIEHVFKACS